MTLDKCQNCIYLKHFDNGIYQCTNILNKQYSNNILDPFIIRIKNCKYYKKQG